MVMLTLDVSPGFEEVLTCVKLNYGIESDSEAIEKMAEEYDEVVNQRKVRPEYLEKLNRILKEDGVTRYSSIEEWEEAMLSEDV